MVWIESRFCGHATSSSGVKTYKELLVVCADYRGLEQLLIELREKYDALAASTKSLAYIDLSKMAVDPEKPLIETVSATFEQGIELPSKVGLNNALLPMKDYFLWSRDNLINQDIAYP